MSTFNNSAKLFNELYFEYYKPVVSYFSKRFDKNEAEDLAQTVFLKLWAYIRVVPEIKRKKSLVFKIAKNVLVDRLRQKKFFASLDTLDTLEISETVGVFDDFTAAVTRDLLKNLSDRDREIVTLKTDGWSSREIASVQKTSSSAVRTRLIEIRKALKKNM